MKRRNGPVAILFVAAVSLVSASRAFASATLKQVHARPDGQIELEFDAPIDPDQVKTEYFRDIVQVSLTDTTVYPAKIMGADTEHVSKIFAYQYAPKLVRARFTVRSGNAESYQSAVSVKPNGRSLLVKFAAPKSAAPIKAAAAAAIQPISQIAKAAPPAEITTETKAAAPVVIERIAEKTAEKAPEKTETTKHSGRSLTGKPTQIAGNNLPAAPSRLRWMFALVLVFGGAFLSIRFAISRRKGKRRTDAAEGRLVSWTKRVLGEARQHARPRGSRLHASDRSEEEHPRRARAREDARPRRRR